MPVGINYRIVNEGNLEVNYELFYLLMCRGIGLKDWGTNQLTDLIEEKSGESKLGLSEPL